MSETWKRWEDRTVDGRFLLQIYVGGSDHSAVFLTKDADSKPAAIKLISADGADAEKQLLRWKAAGELTHPNLIRIFATGRCEMDGTQLVYVVTEYAEESLSQILPERALTAEEARGMLRPILQALQFVHDKGFVHGGIQPSNILAIRDQVKLSSDALRVPDEGRRGRGATSAYDPPEAATGAISTPTDVWQLGMTLIEVLTQRLPVWGRVGPSAPEVPAAVPEPFREIAVHCLQVDAGKRWTVGEISDHLQSARPVTASAQPEKSPSPPAISGRQAESAKWPYWLGLAAVVTIALILIARPKPSNPPAEVHSTQAQPGATAENSEAGGGEKASANADTKSADNQGEVVQRVMPQVSPSARRTIQGTIKVRVKVKVDAAGNVANATLESAGPSKYFSRVAMEAARDWKFSPAEVGAEWRLQFAFSRARTEASAVRAKR